MSLESVGQLNSDFVAVSTIVRLNIAELKDSTEVVGESCS